MHLSNNTLNSSLLPELGYLMCLSDLHLYNKYLSGTLPSSLVNLTNLSYLLLHNNNFSADVPYIKKEMMSRDSSPRSLR